MSGIVGVVDWSGRDVALGSTAGPAAQPQPLTLDDRVWIVADARIDARADLVRALTAAGRAGLRDACDAALILHAYHAWGDACVRHLLGDFAFAIWDGARRRLYCARDHFGVKPFFHAETATGVVFSSSLEWVRRHPAVSDALDADVIGEFLRHGGLQDPTSTCFARIRRLPAAHRLIGEAAVRVERYWMLPTDREIRYRRAGDYVDRFNELMTRAVEDRLRSRRVGVLMSGGLDSTTVAAIARRCLARDGAGFELRAYTTVCDRLIEDPERHWAQLAADALGMPVHYRVVDDYRLFERWDKPELSRPEPESDPLLAVHVDQLQEAALHGPILLTGYGADPAMRLPLAYVSRLLARGKLLRLGTELARYVGVAHRLPRVRLGVHARRWLGLAREARPEPPTWLRIPAPLLRAADARAPVHPTRPEAYALLTSGDWPALFETYHPALTGVTVEVRHPFFDLRVVEFLLAIPAMPWCYDKTLVRVAMRGALPETIRLRPKTVAVADPVIAMLRSPDAAWVDRFAPAPALGRYVDRDLVPRVCGESDASRAWRDLRPLCLNYWLEGGLHGSTS